jgi:cephalosporin hydroxylase
VDVPLISLTLKRLLKMGSIVRESLAEDGVLETVQKVPGFLIYLCETQLLRAHNRLRSSSEYVPPSNLTAFDEILSRSQTPTDISDHLDRLFTESVPVDPATIVELGVRGGESTYVFERVARLTGADLVSVDIEDCSGITDYDRWHFVQSDDVEFATRFETWCVDRGIDSGIDVLFVDTSHLYEHTVDEIDEWFPLLSDRAVVFFHDTNLTRYYRREDGTLGRGWDNDRGVIRALEDYFGCSFDETESFVTTQSPFVVKHFPYCNGLTVLQKTAALD